MGTVATPRLTEPIEPILGVASETASRSGRSPSALVRVNGLVSARCRHGADDGAKGPRRHDESHQGLLFGQGNRIQELKDLPRSLPELRLWKGEPLPRRLSERILGDWQVVEERGEQFRALLAERRRIMRSADDAGTKCARKLYRLARNRGGAAWLFALEFFSWREFRNRSQALSRRRARRRPAPRTRAAGASTAHRCGVGRRGWPGGWRGGPCWGRCRAEREKLDPRRQAAATAGDRQLRRIVRPRVGVLLSYDPIAAESWRSVDGAGQLVQYRRSSIRIE
jgi:hypothetical protein